MSDEWEQMEMEPPCVRCLYHFDNSCVPYNTQRSIEDCINGMKEFDHIINKLIQKEENK